MTVTTAALPSDEDVLDALVRGWVGIGYLWGRCTAFGDRTAAIWTSTMT